ncbi:MAG: hypothetical protein QW136_00020 [Nitrososphaerales archaeon]
MKWVKENRVGKVKIVLARIGEENGCKKCWDALERDCTEMGFPDPYECQDDFHVRVPAS